MVELPCGGTVVAALPPDGADLAEMSMWLESGCRGPATTRLGFASLRWEAGRDRVVAASGFRRGVEWYVGRTSHTVAFGTLLPHVLDAIGGGVLDTATLAEYCISGTNGHKTIYDDVGRVPFGYFIDSHLPELSKLESPLAVQPWFDVSPLARIRGRSEAAETDSCWSPSRMLSQQAFLAGGRWLR